jgi:hypothetical protein
VLGCGWMLLAIDHQSWRPMLTNLGGQPSFLAREHN